MQLLSVRFGAKITGLDAPLTAQANRNPRLQAAYEQARRHLKTALGEPGIQQVLDEFHTPGVLVSIHPENQYSAFLQTFTEANQKHLTPSERRYAEGMTSRNPLRRWITQLWVITQLPAESRVLYLLTGRLPHPFQAFAEAGKILRTLQARPRNDQEGFNVAVLLGQRTGLFGHYSLRQFQHPTQVKNLVAEIADSALALINSGAHQLRDSGSK